MELETCATCPVCPDGSFAGINNSQNLMKIKMKLIAALKIWVVIYPSILLFNVLFGAALTELPSYQRMLILTLALVPWMVFVAIPGLERLLRKIKAD
jgi:antibiotic biosynthesis monooxygenase (ABM) superfamily enzyme